MFDAVDVAALPPSAEIVAGYVDGNWPTYDDLLVAFPKAQHVSITVRGAAGAMVADCETGDLNPQTAAHWAAAEIAAGRRPCIYYSKAAAPTVTAAFNNIKLSAADVDFWVADWTGQPHLVSGSVATQYADPKTSGGNFDISETIPGWPKKKLDPQPPQGDDMEGVAQWETGGQTHIAAVINNKMIHWWQTTGGNPTGPAWTVEELPIPA